ncbi:hypothetical protein MSG28_009226 [Choristoneura fumiferana]|uniref:Uncharacterized protein n=1 Tax=Choristoneura fumiferana TaxID=7141 RepID=A0ACC0KWK8_CHOFU|nr:hypothetical protein MSG28_009226 [Choristoneura fumiferana]
MSVALALHGSELQARTAAHQLPYHRGRCLLLNIGNVTAELEFQRLQQEQLRRQELVRRGQHGMYPGPPLSLLPLLEQMRPQPQSNVGSPWPATAQLAQLTASARSPPPDPDAPLNLSKQRSPSPAPLMMPRFVPYPPMEESPQYSLQKEEEYAGLVFTPNN